MSSFTATCRRTSGYRGRRGRLQRAATRDLLFELEAQAAAGEPTAGRAPADPEPKAVAMEVLRLGGEEVLVAVRAEQPRALPADGPRRRRPSVMDLMPRKQDRIRRPFCWRRFFVSAAVPSGLGSAALLAAYWIVH